MTTLDIQSVACTIAILIFGHFVITLHNRQDGVTKDIMLVDIFSVQESLLYNQPLRFRKDLRMIFFCDL